MCGGGGGGGGVGSTALAVCNSNKLHVIQFLERLLVCFF